MLLLDWSTTFVGICLLAGWVLFFWLKILDAGRKDMSRSIGATATKNPPFVSLYDIRRAYKALHAVCARADYPPPKLRIARNNIINAYASPKHIMLTVGIIRHLSDRALSALIAHELAHILHRDSEKLTYRHLVEKVIFFNGLFALILASGVFIFLGSSDAIALSVTFWLTSVASVAFLLARFQIRYHSRKVEYAADARAAELTSTAAVRELLLALNGYRRGWLFDYDKLFTEVRAMTHPKQGVVFMVLGCILAVPIIVVSLLMSAVERTFAGIGYLFARFHSTHPLHKQRIRALD